MISLLAGILALYQHPNVPHLSNVMDQAHTGAILTIDLSAIVQNYQLLQQKVGATLCAAAVKANAYGLGIERVVPALVQAGCRHFFVAHLDEAFALRPYVPETAHIFVLHGPLPGTEAEFFHHRFTPVLNSLQQIKAWHNLAQAQQQPLPAIIQIDTGMSRMGMAETEVESWLADPAFLKSIPPMFLMSHLCCAEHQHHPMNRLQLERFTTVSQRLPHVATSLANSSGIFLGSDYHFNLVRPGAALYGITPIAHHPNPMQPVMTLYGRIIQIRTIQRGDYVGYGASYRALEERKIATVSIGYADGWLRSMSNRGIVFINGNPAPMVGTISMDSITVDVSTISAESLQPGALVELIGPHHTVDQVAKLAGSIAYEILTGLGTRYYRAYIEDGFPSLV